jgi:L-ascorbate metabolism protein UlaG (beta-lactamase superfamily)
MTSKVEASMDRLTWIGHSTVLLELGGARLLTDPILVGRIAHIRRHGPPPAPETTRDLDAVALSHLHLDHLHLPSLRRLDGAVPLVAPRGAGDWLRGKGFADVRELAPWEQLEIAGVRITGVPADHPERRFPGVGPTAVPLGFVLEAPGGRRAYFAGDTDLFDELAEVGAGGLDLALLPVWGWGTTLTEGHLDPEKAAHAAAALRPRLVVPIHWGTLFPIGRARRFRHLLTDPPHEFAEHAARVAPGVAVSVLQPGESLDLPPSA